MFIDIVLKKLKIWWNILIIQNTELAIVADAIRVIGFFGATDFTDHRLLPSHAFRVTNLLSYMTTLSPQIF